MISQACNVLVPVRGGGSYSGFLAVECKKKGRGIILPGGQWEGHKTKGFGAGESYSDCAVRELYEETGLKLNEKPHLLHSSMNVDGWYVFTFLAPVHHQFDVDHLLGKVRDGGRVLVVPAYKLLEGFYRSYYELVFDAYSIHNATLGMQEQLDDVKDDLRRSGLPRRELDDR